MSQHGSSDEHAEISAAQNPSGEHINQAAKANLGDFDVSDEDARRHGAAEANGRRLVYLDQFQSVSYPKIDADVASARIDQPVRFKKARNAFFFDGARFTPHNDTKRVPASSEQLYRRRISWLFASHDLSAATTSIGSTG